jgi:hypothetical protein
MCRCGIVFAGYRNSTSSRSGARGRRFSRFQVDANPEEEEDQRHYCKQSEAECDQTEEYRRNNDHEVSPWLAGGCSHRKQRKQRLPRTPAD